NDQGNDVKQLQERLIELGYYTGKVSGKYLDGTRSAVANVQDDFGMESTGAADVWTLELIYSDITKPTPTPIPAFASSTYVEFTRTLSYGVTGNDVQKVQQRLMDLGYFTYKKTTTGYYKNTQQAVKDFQAKNGLLQTGNVDEKTWNVLFNDDSVVAADGVAKPTATPEPIPFAIEVDVNNQVVKIWAYNDETGEHSDLVKCFLCSTGTKSHPSAPGTYVLSGRRARWCEFPTWGGGKAQYWVKIDDEIAFHSVLYRAYDETTLVESSLNNLGKRASHGCVRLTVADAKWLYDNCRAGTVVTIHEDAPADPELRAAIKPGALDKDAKLPVATPTPIAYAYDSANPPAGEFRTLSNKKTGEDVYWLQMTLKKLGYYTGTCTGTYLDGTKEAVKAFQRAWHLSVTGTVNKETMEAVVQQAASLQKKATPQPTLTPPVMTPTPLPTPSPTPLPTPSPTPLPTASPTK
ncbi:MAG: peptidoglycan-binding protein, partial [Clostridia bacterium]|nr:peptidoglycan-binding protein [Clostridia bacterium]